MELGKSAIEKSLSLGATEAEAYTQRTKTIRVGFSDQIDDFRTIESMGIALRVSIGKRIANYATSLLNENEIAEAVDKVVKIARVAPEDPDWKHMNEKFGHSNAEGYYDEIAASLKHEEIVESLGSAINCMKSYDKRARPTIGSLTTSVTSVSIVNSHGGDCERKETAIGVSMNAKAEEAGLQSSWGEHQEARCWADLDLDALATKSAEKAVKFLKAKPIPSCQTSLIFRNQIFAGIIGIMLGGPVNADWVQKGRSPLSGKLNAQIASENVCILDDGTMKEGMQTRRFDDEGFPTQKTPIIEAGVLRNFLYDTYTASKDNVQSTGNAFRLNYWSNPEPSPSNFVLKAGGISPEEIVADTKSGIYVEATIGEWLSSPISGELKATMTHGFTVEKGELTHPVKDVVFSGNFHEILRSGIEMVGKDLRNSGQNYSPTVKLAQLTVAGRT